MANRRPDHVPQRTCTVCRTVHPQREMRRAVRTAGGTVVWDASGRLAGRGAYVCADPACQDEARQAAALKRALGAAPAGLTGEVAHATA